MRCLLGRVLKHLLGVISGVGKGIIGMKYAMRADFEFLDTVVNMLVGSSLFRRVTSEDHGS